MLTNKFPKLFLLGMIAILLEGPAQTQAQIIVLSSPSWSQATMGIGTGSYAPAWNTYGLPPEYPVTFAMPLPYSINPDSCNGIASAGRSYVSGSISCGPGQSTASAGSTYRMDVYADVVPDSNVRVKFQANFNINWYGYAAEAENVAGFNFYATVGDNVGAQVNRITAPYLLNGTLENSGQWAAAVRPPANSAYVSGGKTYYKLGMVETIGSGSLHAATANARYNSAITGITANYIGKYLSMYGGDNQTRRVNEELPEPLSVQVLDGETGELIPNVPITFTIPNSANGARFPNGQTSIVVNTDIVHSTNAIIAAVRLTLGTSTGTYKVTATCPADICTSGAREVAFIATAVDKELTCVNCEWHGTAGRKLRNPFRLRVLDKLTGNPVAGSAVTYSVISFTDKDGNTTPGPNGAILSPVSTISDIYGFSRSYLTPGTTEGIHIVRARCETCLNGQEQIARGIVHNYDITPEVDRVIVGDPNAAGPDCLPLTPMLRITSPGHNVSFTSHAGENEVGLAAELRLPGCITFTPGPITWQISDAPGDFIDSGNPTLGSGKFTVDTLPSATEGRALPLAYKVSASVDILGRTITAAPVKAKQDEIDKCRQEYFDVSLPTKDLRVEPYFSQYVRNRFTLGVDGDYVKYSDCFAHVFPLTGAAEVVRLRGLGFGLNVTSGYRSARHNKLQKGVWNSSHIFGDAVDIQATTVDGPHMGPLWLGANCPKILESRKPYPYSPLNKDKGPQLVLKGVCDGTGKTDWQGNPVEGNFANEFIPFLTDLNDNNKDDILEDLSPQNGITDVFDWHTARVIHLGN